MKNIIHSNIELFSFFEMTPDLVCIAGKDGFLKNVNPTVIEKLGYSEEELLSRPISTFIFEEDRDLTDKSRSSLLGGKMLQNFVNRYIKKDGNLIWLEWTSIYFSDKEIVFAIAKDVTERKKIEMEVEVQFNKYKSLANHFKLSQEKDKKILAYELHEELAQLVSALKMDIDWIASLIPGEENPLHKKVEHALAVSNLLVKTIQRISFFVSPRILDDFGLKAALEWLCKEFSILYGIPCSSESNCKEENLVYEMKLDFFRLCQEALVSVINPDAVKSIMIRIVENDECILLDMHDEGNGFIIVNEKQAVGLISMQERVASINGILTIKDETEMGTGITVTIENDRMDLTKMGFTKPVN